MSILKKTKFRAIMKFEDAIKELLDVGFNETDIKDIFKDILVREIRTRVALEKLGKELDKSLE